MKFIYTNTYNAFRKYLEFEGYHKVDKSELENLNKKFNDKFEDIYENQPRIIIDNSYAKLVEEVIPYKGYLLFVIGNETTKILYNYVADDKECEVLGKDLKSRIKYKMYNIADYKVGNLTVNMEIFNRLIENKNISIVNTFDMFIDYCDIKGLPQSRSVNEEIYNYFTEALNGKLEDEMVSINYKDNEQSYWFDYINLKNELIIIQKHYLEETCPF